MRRKKQRLERFLKGEAARIKIKRMSDYSDPFLAPDGYFLFKARDGFDELDELSLEARGLFFELMRVSGKWKLIGVITDKDNEPVTIELLSEWIALPIETIVKPLKELFENNWIEFR